MSVNVFHHISRMKGKNHTIISIDTEKCLTKSKTHLMIKTLYKLGRNRVMISFHLLSLYVSQLFYKFQTPWYFKQSSSWWGIHSDLHQSYSCSHTRGSCPSACIASYSSSHTSPKDFTIYLGIQIRSIHSKPDLGVQ